MPRPQTTIPLSKTKLTLAVIAGGLFVVGCIWVLQSPPSPHSRGLFNNPVVRQVVSVIGIAVFGFGAVFGTRKLRDQKPGLILDETGIHNNSSVGQDRLIPWTDIATIEWDKIGRQKFVVIMLTDPAAYIAKENLWMRLLLRANIKLCGSPVAIASNALKINFDDLLDLCDEYFAEYGTPS